MQVVDMPTYRHSGNPPDGSHRAYTPRRSFGSWRTSSLVNGRKSLSSWYLSANRFIG